MQGLFKTISFQALIGFMALSLMAENAFAQATGGGELGGTGSSTGLDEAGGKTLGSVIQALIDNTSTLPGLLTGTCYLAGIAIGFMAILKVKDHVESPNNTPIWDPIKRILTAGSFLAAPYVVSVVRSLISGDDDGSGYDGSGFNGQSSGTGLDAMIVKLMKDIFVPAQHLFGWFGYIAGIMLVIVGISRLLKTEQQGPQGPTGIGTIMTFLVAGCLFSLNAMITYVSGTLFNSSTLETNGVLQYTDGLNGAEAHIHAVISAVVAFSIVLGWISMIRGFFIVRGVSEGNSQASMMAALTHIIGGVIAINLGSIINAVQSTLGIAQYGIKFS